METQRWRRSQRLSLRKESSRAFYACATRAADVESRVDLVSGRLHRRHAAVRPEFIDRRSELSRNSNRGGNIRSPLRSTWLRSDGGATGRERATACRPTARV